MLKSQGIEEEPARKTKKELWGQMEISRKMCPESQIEKVEINYIQCWFQIDWPLYLTVAWAIKVESWGKSLVIKVEQGMGREEWGSRRKKF